MKNSKTLISIISLVGLVISSFVIMYYWSANSLVEIKHVPIQIMILILVYIVLQFLKRLITKTQNWWDWFYYIGLLAVALPVFMVTETNFSSLLIGAQIGVSFLVLPILIEGFFLVKQNHS